MGNGEGKGPEKPRPRSGPRLVLPLPGESQAIGGESSGVMFSPERGRKGPQLVPVPGVFEPVGVDTHRDLTEGQKRELAININKLSSDQVVNLIAHLREGMGDVSEVLRAYSEGKPMLKPDGNRDDQWGYARSVVSKHRSGELVIPWWPKDITLEKIV